MKHDLGVLRETLNRLNGELVAGELRLQEKGGWDMSIVNTDIIAAGDSSIRKWEEAFSKKMESSPVNHDDLLQAWEKLDATLSRSACSNFSTEVVDTADCERRIAKVTAIFTAPTLTHCALITFRSNM